MTKPALLSVNSPDILMVCADASQVVCFLIPPERLDSMILVGSFQLRTFYDSMITQKMFFGTWWDADRLQR